LHFISAKIEICLVQINPPESPFYTLSGEYIDNSFVWNRKELPVAAEQKSST
jgi:hypothetical protein